MHRFKILKLNTLFVIFFLMCLPKVFAEDKISEFCSNMLETQGVCPDEACQIGCLDGVFYEGCEEGCVPKPCLDQNPGFCPQDSCQILIGCDGQPVCYDRFEGEPESCGGLSYVGNLDCCPGLIKRCGVEFFNGTCDMVASNSLEGVPICIPCGNGICNQFENRCNCPEDCDN